MVSTCELIESFGTFRCVVLPLKREDALQSYKFKIEDSFKWCENAKVLQNTALIVDRVLVKPGFLGILGVCISFPGISYDTFVHYETSSNSQ